MLIMSPSLNRQVPGFLEIILFIFVPVIAFLLGLYSDRYFLNLNNYEFEKTFQYKQLTDEMSHLPMPGRKSAPIVQPDSTWKTYTDAALNGSFQYPPDWTFNPALHDSQNPIQESITLSHIPGELQISVNENKNSEPILTYLKKQPWAEFSNPKNYSLDKKLNAVGEEYYELKFYTTKELNALAPYWRHVFFIKNYRVIEFSSSNGTRADLEYNSSPAALRDLGTINAIIDSFKFN